MDDESLGSVDIEVDAVEIDASGTSTDTGTLNSIRGLPAEFRLSPKQMEMMPKGRQKKDEVTGHRHLQIFFDRHDEILKMLRDGVTKRVIHTKLGVSRNALDGYIKDCSDLQEAWSDAQEDLLDLQEEIVDEIATLDCTMVEGEGGSFPRYDGRSLATKFNAAKLRLERLGGKRGWNPKIETNEVGAGARAPLILVGSVSDAMIAEANEENRRLYEEAIKGLEGIPRG